MSDFFQKNASSADGDVANASDIEKSKPGRTDIRYDKKVSTVTSASNVTSKYKVKEWPTLSGDFVTGTNALGMNVEMVERKRAYMRLEQKRNDYLDEVALILDAHKILEEEEAADRAARGITSITIEEVEKIRSDAYEEGKSQGHDEGYQNGLEEGRADGVKQGHDEGLAMGKEEGYAMGLEQGRAEGFEKGQDEGIESGQKLVLEQVERFRFLADSLANPLREVDRDVTDEIAYIISRLAKVIIKKEINSNADFLKQSIEHALSILPSANKGVSIYLNPEDYAVITAAIGNDYIKEQGWDLKESDKLSPGDIKVVNANSEIDWRINDRIDSLLDDFLSKVYPTVDSALRESIDGCPEYNELPKKTLAPRNLNDISEALKSKAKQRTPAEPETMEVPDQEVQEAPVDQDNLAQTMEAQSPLTDDPAPYVDDYGHPVYQSPDGQLYYFDENNNRVYVDENGVPLEEQPVQATAAPDIGS